MYIPKHNAFFIHIPKTGGKSIEFYFLREMNVEVSTKNSMSVFNSHSDLMIGQHDGEQRAHYTVQQLQDSEKFYNSDYRFTIVRHPVQRFVSEYAWRQTSGKKCTIGELLDELVAQQDSRLLSSWEYCTVDNKLCVDEVFRLEDIPHMERTLSKRFGIRFEMPHDNKSTVEKPQLTPEQIDIIHNVWIKDFEEFGYEIDQ
jgi:hypothetical protein